MTMRFGKREIAHFLGRLAFAMALIYSAVLLVGALVVGVMVPAQRLLLIGGGLGIFSIMLRVGRYGDVRITRDVGMVVALAVTILVALGLQSAQDYDEVDILGRSSFEFGLTAAALIFSWFAIGMGAECIRLNSRHGNFIGACLAFGVLAVVASNGGSGGQVNYEAVNASLGDVRVDHISLQDSVVLLLLFAYARTTGYFRFGVILAAFASLFMLGGRATFFFFALAILFSMWAKGLQSRAISFAATGLCMLYLVVALPQGENYLPEGISRMLFIGGMAEDRSHSARLEILHDSIEGLYAQAAFGDPGWVVRRFGSVGSYIHNLLSVWQFYGIVPFMIVVILMARAMLHFFMRYARRGVKFDDFGGSGLVYAVISIVAAKSLMFGMIWFFMGYWAIKASLRAQYPTGLEG